MLRGGAAGGLALPEIQADTVREVALRKALDAFRSFASPSWCTMSCASPRSRIGGPYTKNANDKLGTEGLLRLLDGVTDRRAGWDDTIVYVDGDGVAKVFGPSETRLASERYGGEISVSPPKKFERFRGPERALGRCFVPTKFGLTECLADVSEADYQRYRRKRRPCGTSSRGSGDDKERRRRRRAVRIGIRYHSLAFASSRVLS